MGFLSPHGAVAHGDVKPVRDVEPGDTFITHFTPSKIGITAAGSILLIAAKWAQAAINPITQQFTAWFKNIRINFYTAIVEYFADTNKKSATARITLAKWINGVGLPIGPPDGSLPTTPDHFTLRAGQLDDDHIIELLISQKDQGAGPQHTSTTKIGTQQDGTYFQHEAKTSTQGNTVELSVRGKDDGTFHTRLNNTNGNFVDTFADTSGDIAYTFDVNGKTKITINQSGDVTVNTPDGATIKLGGTGKEQQLVTKSFVEKYYSKHVHSNGNSGAPTGTPMVPIIDLEIDSATGPFTNTTKAE
jgi:hypothetical protein